MAVITVLKIEGYVYYVEEVKDTHYGGYYQDDDQYLLVDINTNKIVYSSNRNLIGCDLPYGYVPCFDTVYNGVGDSSNIQKMTNIENIIMCYCTRGLDLSAYGFKKTGECMFPGMFTKCVRWRKNI